MKKKTIDTYFALLRSALWNEAECDANQPDWKEVLETARRQTTMGLVCHAALQSEVGQALPDKNKAYLRQRLVSLALSHQRINAMIARLVSAFRDNGIESVLMKGQGVAANYPVAELRQCGDIDLYVGKENYDAACALVNTMAGEKEAAKGYGTELNYHVKVEGIVVEIHRLTSLFYYREMNAIYEPYSDKGMSVGGNSMMINGVNVWLPADTFNVLFVFHHAYNHFISGGIGMRQLCDWAMLLHAKRETINREELLDMLCRLNLLDAWQVFGCIAVDWLGLPKEEMPFYDGNCSKRAKRAVNIILKEGNFGTEWSMAKKHRRQTGLKRRLTTFFSIQIRQWRLFWVFPKIALRLYREKMLGGVKKIIV